MDSQSLQLIQEFKARLPSHVAAQVTRTLIFGSRARGNAQTDSDLDLAVLVKVRTVELEKELEDIAYSLMWDHDFHPIISLKVFSENQFQDFLKRGYSFYRNVQNEGVAV